MYYSSLESVAYILKTQGLTVGANITLIFFRFSTVRTRQKLVCQQTIDYVITQVIEIMTEKRETPRLYVKFSISRKS